jgi:hypothetical protein
MLKKAQQLEWKPTFKEVHLYEELQIAIFQL